MKAFVIKNKEGKYFESQCIANGEPRFYANQFLVFTNKDEVKAVLESIAEDCDYFNIACEVVEITIAEGDLEKENQLLKKRQDDFCDIVVLTIGNWLQQEGFYEEEFEDLFDLIRELKWNNDRDK